MAVEFKPITNYVNDNKSRNPFKRQNKDSMMKTVGAKKQQQQLNGISWKLSTSLTCDMEYTDVYSQLGIEHHWLASVFSYTAAQVLWA